MIGYYRLCFRCELCGEPDIPIGHVLAHLRQSHPDQEWPEIETWPDGAPVVIDDTLTPADFAGVEEAQIAKTPCPACEERELVRDLFTPWCAVVCMGCGSRWTWPQLQHAPRKE